MLLRTETYPSSRRFRRLVFITPVLLFCIELRTVGIVLIPAFQWSTIGGSTGARQIYPGLRRGYAAIAIVFDNQEFRSAFRIW
jgi:hypothetical protein